MSMMRPATLSMLGPIRNVYIENRGFHYRGNMSYDFSPVKVNGLGTGLSLRKNPREAWLATRIRT